MQAKSLSWVLIDHFFTLKFLPMQLLMCARKRVILNYINPTTVNWYGLIVEAGVATVPLLPGWSGPLLLHVQGPGVLLLTGWREVLRFFTQRRK